MENRNGTIFFEKKLTKFDNVRIINSSIVNLLHVVLKFREIEGFSHFSSILIWQILQNRVYLNVLNDASAIFWDAPASRDLENGLTKMWKSVIILIYYAFLHFNLTNCAKSCIIKRVEWCLCYFSETRPLRRGSENGLDNILQIGYHRRSHFTGPFSFRFWWHEWKSMPFPARLVRDRAIPNYRQLGWSRTTER